MIDPKIGRFGIEVLEWFIELYMSITPDTKNSMIILWVAGVLDCILEKNTPLIAG